MTVRIVTDSACDLPQDMADALGIRIVPLSVRFGDTEYIDRET
ncbi:MAG: DegV family protein, partial [Actinobacteria bacterium]|nr:DegV family protein [Actinomycetota bacterium]